MATHTKSKGRGKGHKTRYEWRWNDRRAYRAALAELFPREYALMLCREEMQLLTEDRWWDTPDYRANHIQQYRRTITSIRKQYGLSSADVCEFFRVG